MLSRALRSLLIFALYVCRERERERDGEGVREIEKRERDREGVRERESEKRERERPKDINLLCSSYTGGRTGPRTLAEYACTVIYICVQGNKRVGLRGILLHVSPSGLRL